MSLPLKFVSGKCVESPARAAAPHVKYYKRFDPRLILKRRLRRFSHPSPNSYRGGGENVYYMIDNSATDCSISLKFGTYFHHVTPDLQQTFKVRCKRSRSQR